ncbi:hypothetical protein FOZ61_005071 [Perkinsus olseni]|uniref:Uncharacterized protein n=1 Tax=Perkinsus olseni TaxID=32597 RepID=A0A7J6LWH7_PEROL|nr:hypothetical protein FOZ61_005071 [Perkinsus olseni]KAF4663633.1 hypothetical protein FOL46_004646 [Perkinsus olseni]
MDSNNRASLAEGGGGLCLTPYEWASPLDCSPDPLLQSFRFIDESSPQGRFTAQWRCSEEDKERARYCITLEILRSSTKACWAKLAGALDAVHELLTDFPELSPELIEFLQKDTVPHLQLYWAAIIVCFAPLIALAVFTIPISGPIDVPVWQWLPVLFLIAFQCAFLLAPWSNSFLSDVWGDNRVSKYFKIGLMAGAWQVICLGVVPAFTPYFPLPWMPMIGGVTLLATIVMIYYNVPRDKRSLRSRRKLAMLFMTVGSGVTVFALGYPFLYYLSLELHGFLKVLIFIFFFVFRKVSERVSKHYARLHSIDCYPMIVLFAMYAYEFFVSSVISAVTEVWLAMLLISLDLLENLYYIYCIHQARNPILLHHSMSSNPSQSRSLDRQRDVVEEVARRSSADLAPLPPTRAPNPAGDLSQADETSGYDHCSRKVEVTPHPPVSELKSWLRGSGERVTGNLRDGEGRAPKGALFTSWRCNRRTDSDALNRELNSHSKISTKVGRFKGRGSNFSRVMPSMNASADENPDHRITPSNSGKQQRIKAKEAVSGAPTRIARRGSSMSTLASFSTLAKNPSVIEGKRTSPGLSREGSSMSSRRSSVLEVITDLVTGRNTREMGDGDEISQRALSIMTIAICKELVEVLAPVQYLICFIVLRSSNPKLHDTFWDMADEEFLRGIRRLVIDIVAEACLFMLLIFVIKRRLSESVISIALRLGHHFLWPFFTVQLSMMTYYIVLQYSNAGMTFSLDVKWIGEKNTTWHGGNCYTAGNETIEEVC